MNVQSALEEHLQVTLGSDIRLVMVRARCRDAVRFLKWKGPGTSLGLMAERARGTVDRRN